MKNSMVQVKNILDSIGKTPSKNKKEEILRSNGDNELLKEVLQFMYCDLITTGLSSKKLNKEVDPISGCEDIDDLMGYLKENNTGSDKDIFTVQRYISNQPDELQDLYSLIATKNLKIGITKSTVNKAYGKNFIEDFKVMLADRYDKHSDKVSNFIITEKMDGIRCILQKSGGEVTFRTRQGKAILGLDQIASDAKNLPDYTVLDGELVLANPNNLNSADLFRETMKVVRKDGKKKDVIFHAFDILPLHEFQDGKSTARAIDRKEDLKLTVGA